MAPDGTGWHPGRTQMASRWHPDGAQMAPRAAPVARVDGSLCTGSVTATGRDVPLYRLREVSWGRARKRGPPKKRYHWYLVGQRVTKNLRFLKIARNIGV